MNRRLVLHAVPDAVGTEGAAVVVCLACRVDFDGQPDAGHAAYFAGVHNDLHHGAVPVAFPVDPPPAAASGTDMDHDGGDAA